MLTDFQNSFADRLGDKFATTKNIPTRLKYVCRGVSLHYLVKYERQKTGGSLKYVLRLMINHKVVGL